MRQSVLHCPWKEGKAGDDTVVVVMKLDAIVIDKQAKNDVEAYMRLASSWSFRSFEKKRRYVKTYIPFFVQHRMFLESGVFRFPLFMVSPPPIDSIC